MEDLMADFVASFDGLQTFIHLNAVHKGFWENDNPAYDGTKIALMHSELSEALEAMREGNPLSIKIPGYSHVAEELADTVIRIMDYCEARNIPLASAMLSKVKYNVGRGYKHGKEF